MKKAIFITIVSLIVLSCQMTSNKQIEKKEILGLQDIVWVV